MANVLSSEPSFMGYKPEVVRMIIDLEHVVLHAEEWVRAAGEQARIRLSEEFTTTRKPDASPVTQVDLELESELIRSIREVYPDHAILAEESGWTNGQGDDGRYCWLIDPLDGTRNYARRLPLFSVTVALICDGVPVVGVVYDPIADRMYSAVRGKGATLNGIPMHVANRTWESDSLVGVPGGPRHELPSAITDLWIRRCILRNLGSTALHLALVGAGSLDAAYGQNCHWWDIAAGAVLISEAGGVLTTPNGQSLFPIDLSRQRNAEVAFLGGGADIHRALLETLG